MPRDHYDHAITGIVRVPERPSPDLEPNRVLQLAQVHATLEIAVQLRALNKHLEKLTTPRFVVPGTEPREQAAQPRPVNTPEMYESIGEPLDEAQRIQAEIMREDDEAMRKQREQVNKWNLMYDRRHPKGKQ